MSQEIPLIEMDAVALVDAAIEDCMTFKEVGRRLEGMEPNEQASRHLIAAYDRQCCEPWLIAFLLGCVGHPAGYNTAKDILLSNARGSRESYAGVAMARILGIAAYGDLRQILFGGYPQRIRKGAAYGMVATGSSQLLDDLVTAFNEARLPRYDVSWRAATCNPTDEWLLDLIGSNDPQHRQLACAIVELMVATNFNGRCPGKPVADAIHALINDESLSMNPRHRDHLPRGSM